MKPFVPFLAAALVLSGCAHHTKSAAPSAKPTPTPAQLNPYVDPQAKAPKPFFLLSWMGKVARLIPHKPKPPVATTPQWAGSIRMVNTAENFVLIESGAMAAIVPGETYFSVGSGSETASLRMTSLKNPPFLIADIISGNPSPGEKVYLPKSSVLPAPAPTPKPTPPPKKTQVKPVPLPAPVKAAPAAGH